MSSGYYILWYLNSIVVIHLPQCWYKCSNYDTRVSPKVGANYIHRNYPEHVLCEMGVYIAKIIMTFWIIYHYISYLPTFYSSSSLHTKVIERVPQLLYYYECFSAYVMYSSRVSLKFFRCSILGNGNTVLLNIYLIIPTVFCLFFWIKITSSLYAC